jgi:hypothetical protein
MSKAAQRMRDYRQRVKRGRLVLRVELSDVEAPQKLVELGFLAPGREDDRAAIGRAVSALIEGMSLGVGRKY